MRLAIVRAENGLEVNVSTQSRAELRRSRPRAPACRR